MTTATTTATNQQAFTILQRSVCLTLQCHYLGNNRKVKLDDIDLVNNTDDADPFDGVDVEPDAAVDKTLATDKEQLHLTKRLVNTKTLRPVKRIQSQAKAYLRAKAIPTPRVFGDRSYLVPLGLVEDINDAMTHFTVLLRGEAQILGDRWAAIVAEQAVALGPLFDATQYPTAEDVVNAFSIEWDWVSFAAPDKLETVDTALFEKARTRFEGKMAAAYDEVKVVLRQTLLELTAQVVDALAPTSDGKPRKFRDNVLGKLKTFFADFDLRNISDDAELKAITTRLADLTDGLDGAMLKADDLVRDHVRTQMAAATKDLAALVVTSRRAISFDGAF